MEMEKENLIRLRRLGFRAPFPDDQHASTMGKMGHGQKSGKQCQANRVLVGRNVAAPLLFLNLIMYLIVFGFASWCLNRFINGQTNHPSFGGNGATMFFLIFSILAGVMGIASKLAGANHIRAWRSDSQAAAGSSAIVAWALTALAFGLACKQISIGGFRGWRLRVLEAFVIVLTFTQLLYLLLLHAGVVSSEYGPGYRDTDYPAAGDPMHKGTTGGVPASRIV